MDYLIAYLEGVLSFASPCLLPMLPIYLSYFSARQTRKAAMGAWRHSRRELRPSFAAWGRWPA